MLRIYSEDLISLLYSPEQERREVIKLIRENQWNLESEIDVYKVVGKHQFQQIGDFLGFSPYIIGGKGSYGRCMDCGNIVWLTGGQLCHLCNHKALEEEGY